MGKKEKIMQAFSVRKHAEIAVRYNPSDATTHHLLGRLCFNVANISWIERKLAQTLLADPPTATLDQSLEYFLKAAELRENFISNSLWIANTYKSMNNTPKAKEWYQKVLDTPSFSEFDNLTIEEAKAALKKL
jgi:tetratricopeptide (TPR) repeat protein